MGRDTAACIGLGAALVAKTDPGGIMVVTPADHVIEPAREFGRAVQVAALMAEQAPNSLITFGIVPTQPATGYGYIKRGPQVANHQGLGVYRVEDFVEKPSLSVAQKYVSTGQYYWNSGIFVWRASTVLGALRQISPQIYSAVSRIADAWDTPEQEAVLRREYPAIKSVSFDREVMEKSGDRLVVQAPYRWDDVGSWLALERMNAQDADGNTVLATHAGLETKDCVIVAEPGKLITTIGVSNLVIVQDGDSILIADRNEEGTVKQLVDLLKQKGLEKYL
jgi:mannose-1-phosphate guanylyltransferase